MDPKFEIFHSSIKKVIPTCFYDCIWFYSVYLRVVDCGIRHVFQVCTNYYSFYIKSSENLLKITRNFFLEKKGMWHFLQVCGKQFYWHGWQAHISQVGWPSAYVLYKGATIRIYLQYIGGWGGSRCRGPLTNHACWVHFLMI